MLTFFAGAEYDAQRNVYAYNSSGSAIYHALVPTTLEKSFHLGGERSLRLRYAAFNFINHPLNSFGTGYASQTTLQLSDTSPNATPQTATYNPSTGFGLAPQKLGRRLSEVSLKYNF